MQLRGIEFGPIIGASGVNGWFGEGYPYHRFLKFIPGFSFSGVTFTAKTTTLGPRVGNMPLRSDKLTPREFKPASIMVWPGAGVALNAVGLSGPGLKYLLSLGRWQKIDKPFFISFMSVGATKEERLAELKEAVSILRAEMPNFKSKFGLQINFSCPNTGHDQRELVGEIQDALKEAAALGVPLVPKLSVVIPPSLAIQILEDPNCDAIAVSNSIPWSDVPDGVRKLFFRSERSPLERFGGGAVSGKYLRPLVTEWISQLRRMGCRKPIIGGGGILHAKDVNEFVEAGASAVSPGTIVMLRPWRLSKVIKRAYALLQKEHK